MNITLIKLKGVVTALNSIRSELTRLADCWELELAQSGIYIRPPKADTSGPPPEISYTDEESDWIRERLEFEKKLKGSVVDEVEE